MRCITIVRSRLTRSDSSRVRYYNLSLLPFYGHNGQNGDARCRRRRRRTFVGVSFERESLESFCAGRSLLRCFAIEACRRRVKILTNGYRMNNITLFGCLPELAVVGRRNDAHRYERGRLHETRSRLKSVSYELLSPTLRNPDWRAFGNNCASSGREVLLHGIRVTNLLGFRNNACTPSRTKLWRRADGTEFPNSRYYTNGREFHSRRHLHIFI